MVAISVISVISVGALKSVQSVEFVFELKIHPRLYCIFNRHSIDIQRFSMPFNGIGYSPQM